MTGFLDWYTFDPTGQDRPGLEGETLTTPKSIAVDGVEYRPTTDLSPTETRIVILQRGWVYVGNWAQNGDDVVLSNAKNIRVWGTSKGLGQLALEGPNSKTILDPVGTVRFHILTVVAALDTKASF